jgi:hypothetical protein
VDTAWSGTVARSNYSSTSSLALKSSSIEKTNEESYFNKKPLNVSLQWEKTIVPGPWNPTSILALRAARVQCVAEHDRVGRAVRRPRLG